MQAYPGRILAIDPGDVHVGLAAWDDVFQWAMEVEPDNLVDMLKSFQPQIVVIESYKIYGAQFKRFSKEPTIQLIERVKMFCEAHGVEYFEQDAPLRKIGYASPYYKRHKAAYGLPKSEHARSALAHLIYYINFGKGSK